MQVEIEELIDRLSICNAKLYDVCSKKNSCDNMTREELIALCKKDVLLCGERSKLKGAIREYFGLKGGEVKTY